MFSACKRHIPLPSDTRHRVSFRVSGFDASIGSLGGGPPEAVVRLQAVSAYLYYWSFNSGTAEPDMALNPSGATLTFDAAGTEPMFPNSDFAWDDYPGGRAYSLRGPRSLVISLPLAGIDSLEAIGFDLGSSGTGPKAFALSFSAGGQPYQSIADSVVFEALGDQALNRYDLDFPHTTFPPRASCTCGWTFCRDRGRYGGTMTGSRRRWRTTRPREPCASTTSGSSDREVLERHPIPCRTGCAT